MSKVMGILFPENLKVFVYKDGHQVEGRQCEMNNCAKTIALFAGAYETKNIKLIGDPQLINQMSNELKQKYSINLE